MTRACAPHARVTTEVRRMHNDHRRCIGTREQVRVPGGNGGGNVMYAPQEARSR
jgi:hypothetical protein